MGTKLILSWEGKDPNQNVTDPEHCSVLRKNVFRQMCATLQDCTLSLIYIFVLNVFSVGYPAQAYF